MQWTRVLCGLLAGILGLTGAAQPQEPFADATMQSSGKAGPGLEPLDNLMMAMMARHGIPGGALAMAKDGKLVFAKGYGLADLAGEEARPTTLFSLASLSKPITAAAILKLIQEGKLRLDDLILEVLAHIPAPRGARVDPRLRKVTIRQALNHSGGWDRNVSGDPANWAPQIARRLSVPMPPSPDQFISFVLSLPLDFEPGSQSHYSNVGYIMLGAVIEKLSGQTYEAYVQKNVLAPMGITRARLHKGGLQYFPGEARRYLVGNSEALPPLQQPMLQAAGGWSASPLDMVRFLTALDGSRGKPFLDDKTFALMLEAPPAPLRVQANGNFNGIGWVLTFKDAQRFGYAQDGSWHGARAFMKRSPNGVNWCLAFNACMQPDMLDVRAIQDTAQLVRERVERIQSFPDINLFDEIN
jgi:CubicO group peptidase (beta-lactamase class C family)